MNSTRARSLAECCVSATLLTVTPQTSRNGNIAAISYIVWPVVLNDSFDTALHDIIVVLCGLSMCCWVIHDVCLLRPPSLRVM